MMRIHIFALTAIISVILTPNAARGQGNDDWDIIWRRKMPKPNVVEVGELGGLGKELENRKWHVISTKYHRIHYQPSTEAGKVSQIHDLIDNLYLFLQGRSPTKQKTPIKVFLVPGEWGRSRCSRIGNAMRTGDQGDVPFMMTSLLHEETHLFNFAFLDEKMQGWWAGEFFCIYFQKRALLEAQKKDIRKEIVSGLPEGPQCRLADMANRGKEAFEEAFSALYFFEEAYGREKMNRFRRACLKESRKTNGSPLSDSIFGQVFGKDIDRLDAEWLQFYGWESGPGKNRFHDLDPRLDARVSYASDKASAQEIVRTLAAKAGLRYDWSKSDAQTDSLCRSWVRNVRIDNRPLHEVLLEILDPLGLGYKLEGDAIVLYKKGP